MAGRIRIPGFTNDILLNADQVMYAEIAGDKSSAYVAIYFNNTDVVTQVGEAIYFNNTDVVTQVGERASKHPNGLIALNLYIAYADTGKLLQGLNNALTGFGNGLTVVNHNYGQITSAIWQVNNVTQSRFLE
jgi:hypothetical protein